MRADGDRGPWGDAQKFTLAPPQAPPEAPSVSDKEISIAWPSEPGQRFEFEMASDDRFSKIVQSKQTTEARVVLPRPDPGKYWLRVRATDADGFVGAWSAPQVLDLPEDANLWPLLILLLPLLML